MRKAALPRRAFDLVVRTWVRQPTQLHTGRCDTARTRLESSDVPDRVHSNPQIPSGPGARRASGGAPDHALAVGPRWPLSASGAVGAEYRGLGFRADRRVARYSRRSCGGNVIPSGSVSSAGIRESTLHADDRVRASVSDSLCGTPALHGMTALIGTRVSVDAAQGPECHSNGPVPEGAYAADSRPALSSGVHVREARGFREVRRGAAA